MSPKVPQDQMLDSRRKLSRTKLWIFRILALVIGPTVILGVCEIVLRATGYGYDTSFLIKSDERPGALRDNREFSRRFFPKALARASQTFLVDEAKQANTTRVLVLGGSAAMGDPDPAYGPPRTLEVLLRSRFPQSEFEILNMAVTAINSHIVLPIARDCMRLKPDIVILYLGNNEVHGPFGSGTVFGSKAPPLWIIRSGLLAKKTKSGQAIYGLFGGAKNVPEEWGGMDMFMQQRVAWDDPSLERVYSHFEANLNDIIKVVTKNGAHLIVSNMAVNLRDSPPFVSLPLGSEMAAQGLVSEAEAMLKSKSGQQAVSKLTEALQENPGNAELHFRLGRAFTQTGQAELAKEAYTKARDLDMLRFRADSRINEILTRVANDWASKKRHSVVFLDAEAEFAEASADGVPGSEWFWEHVHLNFSGSYLLGRLLAETVADTLGMEAGGASETWISERECMRRLGVTPFHQRVVLMSMIERLDSAPFTTQLEHGERKERLGQLARGLQQQMAQISPSALIGSFDQLIADSPEDLFLRKKHAMLLSVMGQHEVALKQLEHVQKLLPHDSANQYLIGKLHGQAGAWEAAEAAMRRALTLEPSFTPARTGLGIALRNTKSFKEACEQFASSLSIMPNQPEALLHWALTLIDNGDPDQAIDRLEALVELAPDHAQGHYELALLYEDQRSFDRALSHFQEAARITPTDPGCYVDLSRVALKQGAIAEAIAFCERALQLNPAYAEARNLLQHLQQLQSQ